ncbi:phosphoglycerate dehydrogenase [candidate division KSB1 bacterium]|nr:phosphoglycerate dehydrogenase [candidate division KSB1 bacterium]
MINNIIFDFDSTIINAEGVDLILKASFEKLSNPERTHLLTQLNILTEKATCGEMPLGEAIRQRFDLTRIIKDDVVKAAENMLDHVNPFVKETIQHLRDAGKQIFVFSTSFEEIVRPVTDALLIAWDHVFTNQLIYDFNGQVIGFNEKNPLFLSVGKGFLAEQMKNDGRLPGRTAVVGDGATDLALRKSNIAQIFIFYAGSKVYKDIRQQADFTIDRFDQLLPLVFSEEEYPRELAHSISKVREKTTSSPKVLLLENIHKNAVKKFKEHKYPVKNLNNSPDEKELIETAQNYQILGIRSRTRISASTLTNLPDLWVIGAFCIGINQIDLDAAANSGVPVFNAPYSNTRSVAELVVGETIMLMRRIIEKNAAVHEGRWLKSAEGCNEIRGKTIGIVGYGHIGSQVSVLFEQLGMSVLFHDIVDKLPLGNAKSAQHLYDLLGKSDLVTLHVPDTPETRGMIGARELMAMKKGAILINSSRGKVVVVEALRQAIDSGHISGAAIDVFPEEPGRPDEIFQSVLQGANNVILTPHIGGSTQEAQENIADYVSQKIINFAKSGSTLGALNFPEMDLARMPKTHRILHIHKNVPGVLAKINSVFARRNINVESQILQTKDQIGYLIVDVDDHISDHVIELMQHITETIKIRKIE